MTRRPTRLAELRTLLACATHERTVDALRRLLAERDELRRRVKDLEDALAVAWEAMPQAGAAQ